MVHDYRAAQATTTTTTTDAFPLFSAIYAIAYTGAPPQLMLHALQRSLSAKTAKASPAVAARPRAVDLSGKRALVTGAGRGIGRAIIEHLHRCGAAVVGLDVDGGMLADLRAALGCETVQCDLLNIADLDAKVVVSVIVRFLLFRYHCQTIQVSLSSVRSFRYHCQIIQVSLSNHSGITVRLTYSTFPLHKTSTIDIQGLLQIYFLSTV